MKSIEQSCQDWADKKIQEVKEQFAGICLMLLPAYVIIDKVLISFGILWKQSLVIKKLHKWR